MWSFGAMFSSNVGGSILIEKSRGVAIVMRLSPKWMMESMGKYQSKVLDDNYRGSPMTQETKLVWRSTEMYGQVTPGSPK